MRKKTLDNTLYSILLPVSDFEKDGLLAGKITLLFRSTKPTLSFTGFPITIYFSKKEEVFAKGTLSFLSAVNARIVGPTKQELAKAAMTPKQFRKYHDTVYGWTIDDLEPASLRISEFFNIKTKKPVGSTHYLNHWVYTLNPLYNK